MNISWFAAASLASLAASSAFAECDFDKPVGRCEGSISVDSSGGSKPSFSAEITVKSTAPQCSKVAYFLDNTPHTTVLRNSSSDGESLSSTKPISKKNITVEKCTTYAIKGASGSAKDTQAQVGSFSGRWYGSVGMLLLRAGLTLDIKVNGTNATGVASSANDPDIPFNGIIRGNSMSYKYRQPIGGDPADVVLTLKADGSMSYVGRGNGITLSGTLKRQ